MVKVHHPRRKRSATVLAGSPSQISQEIERRCLPEANALNLFFTMGRVVRDVVGMLIAPALHILQLEHLFTPCQ